MIAARDQHVLVAGIDLQNAVLALGEMRLGLAVAGDVEKVEGDFVQPAGGILEGQREVAMDAAFDLRSLRRAREWFR